MASADFELNATKVVLTLPSPKLEKRRNRAKAKADAGAALEGSVTTTGGAAEPDLRSNQQGNWIPASPATATLDEESGEAKIEHSMEPLAPSRAPDAHNHAVPDAFSRQLAAEDSSKHGNATARHGGDCEASSAAEAAMFDFFINSPPRAIASIEERRTLEVSVSANE